MHAVPKSSEGLVSNCWCFGERIQHFGWLRKRHRQEQSIVLARLLSANCTLLCQCSNFAGEQYLSCLVQKVVVIAVFSHDQTCNYLPLLLPAKLMQTPDLTQLSESLLSLLSARNDTNQRAPQQYENAPQLRGQQAFQQPQPQHFWAQTQQGAYHDVNSGGQQNPAHQPAAYDPWTSAFHRLQDDRQQTGSTGPYPSFAYSSTGQQAPVPAYNHISSSPSDRASAWSSSLSKDESSHSMPTQHGFPASAKLASSLWGGSLWSNGGDSIWSQSADRPSSDNHAQRPQVATPQDNLSLDALSLHRNSTSHPGSLPPGFQPQQHNLFENGHAFPEESRPAPAPSHLAFQQERRPELQQQQGPSALLAALQAGGQCGMLNGSQPHHMPPLGSPGQQHLHQVPHPLHSLLQQQHHQKHHSQQHLPLQPHLHQQQPQIQQPAAAQSPPVPSHLGRMPPPGFPRPLQQNLQEAQQQRASAARAFQPGQVGQPLSVI